jgi:hypothetical protein
LKINLTILEYPTGSVFATPEGMRTLENQRRQKVVIATAVVGDGDQNPGL